MGQSLVLLPRPDGEYLLLQAMTSSCQVINMLIRIKCQIQRVWNKPDASFKHKAPLRHVLGDLLSIICWILNQSTALGSFRGYIECNLYLPNCSPWTATTFLHNMDDRIQKSNSYKVNLCDLNIKCHSSLLKVAEKSNIYLCIPVTSFATAAHHCRMWELLHRTKLLQTSGHETSKAFLPFQVSALFKVESSWLGEKETSDATAFLVMAEILELRALQILCVDGLQVSPTSVSSQISAYIFSCHSQYAHMISAGN